jgi:hypothetical protein
VYMSNTLSFVNLQFKFLLWYESLVVVVLVRMCEYNVDICVLVRTIITANSTPENCQLIKLEGNKIDFRKHVELQKKKFFHVGKQWLILIIKCSKVKATRPKLQNYATTVSWGSRVRKKLDGRTRSLPSSTAASW